MMYVLAELYTLWFVADLNLQLRFIQDLHGLANYWRTSQTGEESLK